MSIITVLKDGANFTKSEQEIVNNILKDPQRIMDATIEEAASYTYSSPASLVRLCQKIGLKGFRDLKIKLASESSALSLDEKRIGVDMPIKQGSSAQDIAKSFFNLHYQALCDIYHNLPLKQIEKAADMLDKANLVTLYGQGESLLIVEDFHYKLNKAGVTSSCHALSGFDSYRPTKMDKECVLVVSHYGNTRKVLSWIKEATQSNVPVILLCANRHSPLLKLATLTILIDNEEDRTAKMGSFASRTAFQYVLDIVYALLFDKHYTENFNRLLEDSENAKIYKGDKIDEIVE